MPPLRGSRQERHRPSLENSNRNFRRDILFALNRGSNFDSPKYKNARPPKRTGIDVVSGTCELPAYLQGELNFPGQTCQFMDLSGSARCRTVAVE
jgi:hypothetical protein